LVINTNSEISPIQQVIHDIKLEALKRSAEVIDETSRGESRKLYSRKGFKHEFSPTVNVSQVLAPSLSDAG